MSFDKSGDLKSDKQPANLAAKRSTPEGAQGEQEEKAAPDEVETYEDFEAPKTSSDTIIEMPAIELALVGGSAAPEPAPPAEEKEPADGVSGQSPGDAGEREKKRSEEEEWASRLAAARAFGVIDSHPFLQAMPYDEDQTEPPDEAYLQKSAPGGLLPKKGVETPISEEALAWLGEENPPLAGAKEQAPADPPQASPQKEERAKEAEHAPLSAQNEKNISNFEEDAPTETASEEDLAALKAGEEDAPGYESFQTEEIPYPPESDSLEEERADTLPGAEIERETTLILEDSIEVPGDAEENPFLQPEEDLQEDLPRPSPEEAIASKEETKEPSSEREPLLLDSAASAPTEEEDDEDVSLLVGWSSQLPEESGQNDAPSPPSSFEARGETPKTPPPLPAATGTRAPLTPPRGATKAPPVPPPTTPASGAHKSVATRTEGTNRPESAGPVKRSIADLEIPPELFESEAPQSEASASAPVGQAPTVPMPKVLPRGWWDTIFNEDFLRTNPAKSEAMTRKEADFIESSLAPKAGDWVLDIACGYGRHVLELAGRGYNMVGLDLSLPYLMLAAEISTRRKLNANFVHGDMRDLPFKEYFDSTYCTFTSFGYFDDETNLDVLRGIGRSLKSKGRLLLELINRDFAVMACPLRGWWEGVGCVMLEETEFNYISSLLSTRRSVIFEDGRQALQETQVRLYSLHELSALLRQSGFKILEVSGGIDLRGVFFGADSTHLVVLAEKQR